MKTIEIYEKTETSKLQKMLKTYENNLKKIELDILKCPNDELNKEIVDYEIDISLIRMELNKRLWQEYVDN